MYFFDFYLLVWEFEAISSRLKRVGPFPNCYRDRPNSLIVEYEDSGILRWSKGCTFPFDRKFSIQVCGIRVKKKVKFEMPMEAGLGVSPNARETPWMSDKKKSCLVVAHAGTWFVK
jgi:hypothetical protein